MSFLLRRTKKPIWVGETRSREGAIEEFARSPTDTDGLSLYEVTSDDDRAKVISAVACQRQNTGRIDFIEVERELLEQFGIVSRTPAYGTTPLASANALHCSLDWDAAALRRLAEHLFDNNWTPTEVSAATVRTHVQKLDASQVEGDEAQAFVRKEQAKAKKIAGPQSES